jgi:hypothetical protein
VLPNIHAQLLPKDLSSKESGKSKAAVAAKVEKDEEKGAKAAE